MGFPPADRYSRRILAAQVARLSSSALFQQLQELISVEAMRTSLAAAASRFDLAEEYVLEVVKEYLYRKPPTAFPYDRFEASTQTPECFVITDAEGEAQAAPLPGESEEALGLFPWARSNGYKGAKRQCLVEIVRGEAPRAEDLHGLWTLSREIGDTAELWPRQLRSAYQFATDWMLS